MFFLDTIPIKIVVLSGLAIYLRTGKLKERSGYLKEQRDQLGLKTTLSLPSGMALSLSVVIDEQRALQQPSKNMAIKESVKGIL